MSDFVYLASSSQSRQELLKISNIPFKVIKQDANEDQFSRNDSLQNVVSQIAQEKMRCAILPVGQFDGEIAYVIASDTMGVSKSGEVFGKPKDQADAIRMLQAYRGGAETGTAFVLDKRVWRVKSLIDSTGSQSLPSFDKLRMSGYNGQAPCADLIDTRLVSGQVASGYWQVLESVTCYVNATYSFNVPDQMLELYFKHAVEKFGISYLDVSGAVAIEDYGLQFVTNFQGSFTAVMGLPLYELRQELAKMGFRFS